ncbi:MAG: hypothetical protein IPO00_03615 [Betaproteobacteria bacterium]|nr:hypothetical protein [Betaproteobacteria bacterium]
MSEIAASVMLSALSPSSEAGAGAAGLRRRRARLVPTFTGRLGLVLGLVLDIARGW